MNMLYVVIKIIFKIWLYNSALDDFIFLDPPQNDIYIKISKWPFFSKPI